MDKSCEIPIPRGALATEHFSLPQTALRRGDASPSRKLPATETRCGLGTGMLPPLCKEFRRRSLAEGCSVPVYTIQYVRCVRSFRGKTFPFVPHRTAWLARES